MQVSVVRRTYAWSAGSVRRGGVGGAFWCGAGAVFVVLAKRMTVDTPKAVSLPRKRWRTRGRTCKCGKKAVPGQVLCRECRRICRRAWLKKHPRTEIQTLRNRIMTRYRM